MVEALLSIAMLAGGVTLFIMFRRAPRPPLEVEPFNQMAEESLRPRSRLEWALRIGAMIGIVALLMIFISLTHEAKLLPPTDIIYPAVAIAGGLCALALWFLRGKGRR